MLQLKQFGSEHGQSASDPLHVKNLGDDARDPAVVILLPAAPAPAAVVAPSAAAAAAICKRTHAGAKCCGASAQGHFLVFHRVKKGCGKCVRLKQAHRWKKGVCSQTRASEREGERV